MESNEEEGRLEPRQGYMTTSVCGGVGGQVDDHKELGGWEDDGADSGKNGQIVKTVHINQYATDP